MEKLTVKGIQDLAAEILAGQPNGMRYGELVKTIHGKSLSTPINTIHGAIVRLISVRNDVAKPSKGLFKHVKHMDEKTHVEIPADSQNGEVLNLLEKGLGCNLA